MAQTIEHHGEEEKARYLTQSYDKHILTTYNT